MAKRVRPSELSAIISAELENYSEEVAESIKDDVKEVSKWLLKELKKKSPKKTGTYRKGWRTKVAFEGKNGVRIIVYNAVRPGLTHLLEFGHVKSKGVGRVEGKPHIYPAREKAAQQLENKTKVSVKG